MTPKQKRALNRARKVLYELAILAIEAREAMNSALALLIRAAGAMIGGAAGVHAHGVDDLHDAATRAGRRLQEQAAAAYGEYIAREKAAAGKPQ